MGRKSKIHDSFIFAIAFISRASGSCALSFFFRTSSNIDVVQSRVDITQACYCQMFTLPSDS